MRTMSIESIDHLKGIGPFLHVSLRFCCSSCFESRQSVVCVYGGVMDDVMYGAFCNPVCDPFTSPEATAV